MQSLISLIVPAYNVELYIENCISSILQQTYSNYEVIIVNDGSTDNTAAHLNHYSRLYNHIKVIHKENEGVSIARNTALKIAKGDWITFIDADDTVHPEYLNHLISLVDEDDSIIVGSAQRIDTSTNRVLWELNYPSKKYNIPLCRSEYSEIDYILDCSILCGRLFKRDIIISKNILFNPQISLNEDMLFIYEYLLYIKQIVTTDKVIYNYLRHPNATTLSTKKKHPIEERIIAYKSVQQVYLMLLDNWGILKNPFINTSSSIARIYGKSIITYLRQNQTTMLEYYLSKQDKFFNNYYKPRTMHGKLFKIVMSFPSPLKRYAMKLLIHLIK